MFVHRLVVLRIFGLVLIVGLGLAPLLSPRPADAASATVTYTYVPGVAQYQDAFLKVLNPVLAGLITVKLTGPTVVPFVSATWTSGSITWLTWATPGRALVALGPPATPIPVPASGNGTIAGAGYFVLSPPVGTKTLIDPFGMGTRGIIVLGASLGGFFGGTTTPGQGWGLATGLDGTVGWLLGLPGGGPTSPSLTEVSSSITIVPEPGTGLLLGLGLVGLAVSGRRLRGVRPRG